MRFQSYLHYICSIAVTAVVAVLLLAFAYTSRPSAELGLLPSLRIAEYSQFYEQQQNGQTGEVFRWSAPTAAFNLPRPGDGTFLTLKLASGQPEAVAVALTDGTRTNHFAVAPAPRTYHVLVGGSPFASRLKLALTSAQAPQDAIDARLRGITLRDLAIIGDGRAPLDAVLLGVCTALITLFVLQLAGIRRWLAVAIVAAGVFARAGALVIGAWEIWWLPEQFLLFGCICLIVLLLRAALLRFGLVNQHPAWHVLGLCALVVPLRFALVPMPDAVGDLNVYFLDWARWIRAHDLTQLYASGTDYPPLWPLALGRIGALADFLNVRFTAPLPPPAALLLKLPAILADLALTLLVFFYALRWRPAMHAVAIAAVCALLPPLWIDSAWWGQIDSMPILIVVLALLLFRQQHGLWSWALFALALLIKFQMIVFAPLFGILAIRCYGLRWATVGAVVFAAVFALVCAPLVAAGQLSGLRGAYLASVDRYPYVSLHAYNVWVLLTRGQGTYDFSRLLPGMDDRSIWLFGVSYHQAGLLMFGALVLAACALLWRRFDRAGASAAALLLALGFYMLPTQMHDRYLLPVYPLLLLWWARERVALWPLIVLTVTGTLTLLRAFPLWPAAHAALTPQAIPVSIAALNTGVLIWLCGYALQVWRQPVVAHASRRTISRRPRSLQPRTRLVNR